MQPRTMMRTMVLITGAMLMAGCAMYVNIPPQPGDAAWHDPNHFTVENVMREAMARTLTEHPPEGPFTIDWPAGTTDTTIDEIIADYPQRIASQYVRKTNMDIPRYAFRHIWIRSGKAYVDIQRPALTHTQQLVTVYLSDQPFTGWHVTRTRAWQVPQGQTYQPRTP